MNIDIYVRKEYQKIFENFTELNSNIDHWELLSNLAYLDCLVEDWEDRLNTYLETTFKVKFKSETKKEASALRCGDEYTVSQLDGSTHLVLPAKDRAKPELVLNMLEGVSQIYYILPYKRLDFKVNTRLLTDVILVDAKLKNSTDIHFRVESNYDGTFRQVVKFRQGLYLVRQDKYTINHLTIENIIQDLLANRTSVAYKAANLSIQSAIRFRLVDPMFPSRCQVGKSIGGLTLAIRLFDFKKAPSIETLGFNLPTQNMLKASAGKFNGLTLVSGVFGSGKGTTLNAVGMQMEEEDKLAIASLDDPIEYLRGYSQYEYSNETQLNELVDAFKKMDLNVVFLNEVITQQVAESVFNLVSAGIHVLTTIHTNRVYRVMYKLEELLPKNYISLIPFLNVISYQDKFSKCCPHCARYVSKEIYPEGSDAERLLTFFGLDKIMQPSGCSKCENGILLDGIKVVSEHIEFNDQIKSDLLRLDIHAQFDYLKRLTSEGENLESVIKLALQQGEILIDEAILKLDTWR